MSLAAAAREAARSHPFLLDALRAGVVNYTAAAAFLDLGRDDADTEAVATALRRYAEELDPRPVAGANVNVPVRMQRGVSLADGPASSEEDVVVQVGDRRVVRGGDMTAVRAQGDLGARALERVLGRLRTVSVVVDAAGAAADELVVVVPRRQGAAALRAVEAALAG